MSGAPAARWARCRIPAAAEDAVAELAGDLDASGVLLEPAGELTEATVYLPDTQALRLAELVVRLEEIGGGRPVEVGEQAPADWLERYRDHVRPFTVGRTWFIDPHPGSPTPAPPGRRRLALEPRMAFGSGSHETTQLLLLWLERQSLGGCSVLDVGTGSGVLSFAAVWRGAERAVALDIDLQAVLVGHQTARVQDRSPLPVRLLAAPLAAVIGTFDLVLCNMIPEHALPLLGQLRERLKPAGRLALSGFLASQRDEVTAALGLGGFTVADEWQLDEWAALQAVPREAANG